MPLLLLLLLPLLLLLSMLVLAPTKHASSDLDLSLFAPVFPNTIRDDSDIAPKSYWAISLQETSSRVELLLELHTFSTHMNILFSCAHNDSDAPDEGPPHTLLVTSTQPSPEAFKTTILASIDQPSVVVHDQSVAIVQQEADRSDPVILSLSEERAIIIHPSVGLPAIPQKRGDPQKNPLLEAPAVCLSQVIKRSSSLPKILDD